MVNLKALEQIAPSRALIYSVGAGLVLGGFIYAGLTVYGDSDAGFLTLASIGSVMWLSLVSKLWNPLLGLEQPYWFDWLVVACLVWFMSRHVEQPGHKVLIGVCMLVFTAAGAVSARRRRLGA